jgi:amino acid permease
VSILVFWAALMLPLSMVEKMSSLQGTSLFGVLALVYLVVAVAM